MQEIPLQGHYQAGALEALVQSPMFSGLQQSEHEKILSHGVLLEFEKGELIIEEGQPSDSFFLMVRGQAAVRVRAPTVKQPVEVSRLVSPHVFGEMGLLLRNARTATVQAIEEVLALRFHHRAFDQMLNNIKGFTIQMCVQLAHRLAQTSRRVPPPVEREQIGTLDPQLLRQLPSPFILRHRVLPLQLAKNVLTLGFVDDPTPAVLQMVQRILPGIQIQPRRISNDAFAQALRSHGLFDAGSSESNEAAVSVTGSHAVVGQTSGEDDLPIPHDDEERQLLFERVKPLLQRAVAEGASTLYLSAQEKPRWRIGKELYEMEDQRALQPLDAFMLLAALIPEPRIKRFAEEHYIDFSCTIPDLSRFRINLFRSEKGINAVLRTIPLSPPHPRQLQLPSSLRGITQYRDGLALFAGPPGCGRTTTIAALLEVINHHRSLHIITLEDPIEYVHKSNKALFHQREVGSHTTSLHQALREVLRNVPDVLVVSDIRDPETISLVLEAARNGCLVFASIAVRGAVRAIQHLIDIFPPDQQEQTRLTLAKALRCVVNQALCRHVTDGRVAAFEFFEVDDTTAAAIRQGQHSTLLQLLDQRSENLPIQAHLAQLVKSGQISEEEAYTHTVNRTGLNTLLND